MSHSALPRATRVLAAGDWTEQPTDRVSLGYDDRHRRRVAMKGEQGLEFLLDLPRAAALADGDGLLLDDGRVVVVVGAPEALLEITCYDPFLLLRVAWHLGNRHLPTELRPGALRIRDDHVIADMVRGLGAHVSEVSAVFQPKAEPTGTAAFTGMITLTMMGMGMGMGTTIMSIPMGLETTGDLYRLMSWLSPSYPVGAFSYSHGIEWVVETGEVHHAASLGGWVEDVVLQGGGWNDAVFFSHAWRAANGQDDQALGDVAELAAAFTSSRGRKLETCAQGEAFLAVTERSWPCDALARLRSAWDGAVAYPVAVGVAAAGHGVSLGPALVALLHGYASNLVSAGVRLIPLGQTDAQRIVAGLIDSIEGVARRAPAIPLEEVGGMAVLSDIAAMRHETQYTRLFRT
jgi:urease accessory protein